MMNLSIKQFQQVQRKINLEIRKITIVTGVNGIGKTNISKLLYCLLKSNCYNRCEPALETVNEKIVHLLKKLQSLHNIDFNLDYYEDDNQYYYIDNYMELKDEFIKDNLRLYKDYSEDFELIDKLIKIVSDDSIELHVSLLRTFLMRMFDSNIFTGEICLSQKDCDDVYNVNFTDYDFYDDDFLDYSGNCCVYDNVFYIDNSGTVLDYIDCTGIFSCDHVNSINDSLHVNNTTLFDGDVNKDLIVLEDELVDIIGGVFEFNDMGRLVFNSNDGIVSSLSCTSGGVRNLGVLYLLLHNRQITGDSFIIFDEVENNLHPELQLVFAKWLCKLVEKVGVHVYVNSKSPLFIEAIEVFSRKHRLDEDTSYILLDYCKDGQIKSAHFDYNGLFRLYNNLGDPYDIIDEQRVQNILNL